MPAMNFCRAGSRPCRTSVQGVGIVGTVKFETCINELIAGPNHLLSKILPPKFLEGARVTRSQVACRFAMAEAAVPGRPVGMAFRL